MTDHASPMLTYAQVADLLGVSKRTVQRLKESRKLPFHQVGGQVRFSRQDIARYLASTRKAGEL